MRMEVETCQAFFKSPQVWEGNRVFNLLMRLSLSGIPFALSLSKCEWILVLRQAQHERLSSSIRAESIRKR